MRGGTLIYRRKIAGHCDPSIEIRGEDTRSRPRSVCSFANCATIRKMLTARGLGCNFGIIFQGSL